MGSLWAMSLVREMHLHNLAARSKCHCTPSPKLTGLPPKIRITGSGCPLQILGEEAAMRAAGLPGRNLGALLELCVSSSRRRHAKLLCIAPSLTDDLRRGPEHALMQTLVWEKADSTLRSSQAVPHPSTSRALCRLTSEVGRDPVHSTRYGRRRKTAHAAETVSFADVAIKPDNKNGWLSHATRKSENEF